MTAGIESFVEKLKEKHIKPSPQRIEILKYIADHPCHPSTDQIFHELNKKIPTISKSTIYNTLKIFSDVKLVKELTIEDNIVKYEYNVSDHGHFKCGMCGNIYDFSINIDDFTAQELNGFQIKDKNVYYRGICKNCLRKKGEF